MTQGYNPLFMDFVHRLILLLKHHVSEACCAAIFTQGKHINWWTSWTEIFSFTGHEAEPASSRPSLNKSNSNDGRSTRKEDYFGEERVSSLFNRSHPNVFVSILKIRIS